MKKTNVQVSFTIISNKLIHSDITNRIGIIPTYVRHSNEQLNNGRLFGHDEWGIETDFEESVDIEIQLLKVTELLKSKTDIINMICQEYSAKTSILISINIENEMFPSIGLSTEFMRFAISVNADVGFDFCYF